MTTRKPSRSRSPLRSCRCFDMAGIRGAGSAVEAEGIRRTLARVEDADLVLWMVDATAPEESSAPIRASSAPMRVINKIDLLNPAPNAGLSAPTGAFALSAKTGEGVSELVDILAKSAEEGLAVGEPAVISRARHRAELEAAAQALQRFRGERGGPEIKAEELRIAARHLGRLTGRIDVEEVLGAIFSEFCIGK